MVKLISYPFRLNVGGSVVTKEEGEDYYGDELAMLIRTIPGERELVPDYGIEDPTFGTINDIELLEKISMFGPPVEITETKSAFVSEDRVAVNISYAELPLDSYDLGDDDDYDTDETYDDDDYDDAEFDFSDATDF